MLFEQTLALRAEDEEDGRVMSVFGESASLLHQQLHQLTGQTEGSKFRGVSHRAVFIPSTKQTFSDRGKGWDTNIWCKHGVNGRQRINNGNNGNPR